MLLNNYPGGAMKKKSIVSYHNDLNNINLKEWNSEEMNILFTIFRELKDRGTEVVKLGKEEFLPLIERNGHRIERFLSTLSELQTKISSLTYMERSNIISKNGKRAIKLRAMPIFADFQIVVEDEDYEDNREYSIYGRIEVSKHFEYIINKLNGNFTQWELEEFYRVQSKYSKNIYRLLKQFRSTGLRVIPIDEFRMLTGIPESYRQRDIDKRVLQTAKKDLEDYFPNFKITKLKQEKGNKVTHIEFRFTPDKLAKKGMKEHLEKVKERYKNLNTPMTFEEILSKHIEYVEKKNPDNFDAYLNMSIEQDYPKIAQTSLFELTKPSDDEKAIDFHTHFRKPL